MSPYCHCCALVVLALLGLDQPARAGDACEGQGQIEGIVKDQLGFLTLSEHGDDCSKIARGDFNHDGRPDHAAVLTEITPLEHYADGSPWFRTYVVVFLDLGLPYGQYQAVFVRTDRSKPKLFFLAAISRKGGHDLEVKVAGYSSTEYRWFPGGFKAIEHSAD